MPKVLTKGLVSGVTVALVVTLFLGCTPLVPRRVGGEPLDRRAAGEKEFDPLAFEDDTLVVSSGALNREGIQAAGGAERRTRGEVRSQESFARTVYRVQIFMTKYPELASQKALEAEVIFSEQVYVDFEAPYYRVRVGDFETLEAGEEFLREVRESGYEDAWLVRTRLKEGD